MCGDMNINMDSSSNNKEKALLNNLIKIYTSHTKSYMHSKIMDNSGILKSIILIKEHTISYCKQWNVANKNKILILEEQINQIDKDMNSTKRDKHNYIIL